MNYQKSGLGSRYVGQGENSNAPALRLGCIVSFSLFLSCFIAPCLLYGSIAIRGINLTLELYA